MPGVYSFRLLDSDFISTEVIIEFVRTKGNKKMEEDEDNIVICFECQHEYESEFDEDTGMSTTPCSMCGHDQRDYV